MNLFNLNQYNRRIEKQNHTETLKKLKGKYCIISNIPVNINLLTDYAVLTYKKFSRNLELIPV